VPLLANPSLTTRFAPPLWATLLYLVVLVAMLLLGRWQLLRADEKIELIERAEVARLADPVPAARLDAAAAEQAGIGYARVAAHGRWLPSRQFLWDNRAHGGRAGVEVITPLQLDDGRLLLVNRGWLPLSTRRERLPDVSLDDIAEPVSLGGLMSRPSRGFAQGEAFVADAPWPRYLQYFDYAAMAAALRADVLPAVLQPGAGDPDARWRLTSNWQPAASGPEKHYSYAVQWFAMAIALTIIFGVVNRRRPPSDNAPDDGPETR